MSAWRPVRGIAAQWGALDNIPYPLHSFCMPRRAGATTARGKLMHAISRRRFIRASAAGVAASTLGFPSVVRAAEETPILGLFSYTGAYAEVGPLMERGAK